MFGRIQEEEWLAWPYHLMMGIGRCIATTRIQRAICTIAVLFLLLSVLAQTGVAQAPTGTAEQIELLKAQLQANPADADVYKQLMTLALDLAKDPATRDLAVSAFDAASLTSVPDYKFDALQGEALTQVAQGNLEAAKDTLNSALAVPGHEADPKAVSTLIVLAKETNDDQTIAQLVANPDIGVEGITNAAQYAAQMAGEKNNRSSRKG